MERTFALVGLCAALCAISSCSQGGETVSDAYSLAEAASADTDELRLEISRLRDEVGDLSGRVDDVERNVRDMEYRLPY